MSNRKIIMASLLAACSLAAGAQGGIERALREIESNSTALRSLKKTAEAGIAGNHTGLTLAAPEIGFNYLFGSNSSMPHRQDISVSQEFDFPTLGGARKRLAQGQDSLLLRTYDAERQAYLLAAQKSCINLVYCNALAAVYREQLAVMKEVQALWEESYARGEAAVVELNDARLNVAELELGQAENESERMALSAELLQYNGGRPLVLDDTCYASRPLPPDLDAWRDRALAAWPELRAAEAEVEAKKRARKLAKQENLPALSLGFMQETVPHDIYRGVTFGLAIPLWSNRGKRRQAEAEVAAAEARRKDVETKLSASLEAAYRKALSLARSAERLAVAVKECGNVELWKKAMEAGQLSRPDFLTNVARYFSLSQREIQLRRDAELAKAEVMAIYL